MNKRVESKSEGIADNACERPTEALIRTFSLALEQMLSYLHYSKLNLH